MFGTSLPKETLKDIEKEVGGMERSLKFDIFSGTVDKNAFWLERVEGLENAKRRMEEMATKWPERYFLFCDFSHTVVAQIDGASEIPSEEKAVWLSEVDKPKGISAGAIALEHRSRGLMSVPRLRALPQPGHLAT